MMRQSLWVLGALVLALFLVGSAQVRTVVVPFPRYPGDENLDKLEISEDMAFFDARNSRLVIVRAPATTNAHRAGKMETIPIDLAARIEPDLSVDIVRESSERWLYKYQIKNGSRAKQSIENWRLEIPEPRSPDPLNPQDVAYPVDRSGVWDSIHYGYRPGGWALQWSRKTGQPTLRPGTSLSDFLVEADRKPGFLMSHFEGRREPRRVPEDLPEKLKQRLRRFLESTGGGVSMLTLGPKFRTDQSLRGIAADFHVGISRLAGLGQLDANSPFVQTCLGYLQTVADDTTLDRPGIAPDFEASPQTPLEQSIYQALRLALDLTE